MRRISDNMRRAPALVAVVLALALLLYGFLSYWYSQNLSRGISDALTAYGKQYPISETVRLESGDAPDNPFTLREGDLSDWYLEIYEYRDAFHVLCGCAAAGITLLFVAAGLWLLAARRSDAKKKTPAHGYSRGIVQNYHNFLFTSGSAAGGVRKARQQSRCDIFAVQNSILHMSRRMRDRLKHRLSRVIVKH